MSSCVLDRLIQAVASVAMRVRCDRASPCMPACDIWWNRPDPNMMKFVTMCCENSRLAVQLKTDINQQPDQQNAISCATSVFLGSSRGLVSCCNIYSCQIHTVEVIGSNPIAPTNLINILRVIPIFRCSNCFALCLKPWGKPVDLLRMKAAITHS